jgi:hypothetical protein
MNYGHHTIERVIRGENAGALHLWQAVFDELGLEVTITTKARQLTETQLDTIAERRNNGNH